MKIDSGLKVVQLALNTADLAGTLRLYYELFGFQNAGANVLWGDTNRIQGLGPEARSLLWWMIGGASFFQLELFHHTEPAQRPLRVDWRPSDHGWVRYGIVVDDFERTLAGLENWKISPLGAVGLGIDGRRRVAFRDPFVGAIVEVIESGDGSNCPRLAYAANSVADLPAARRYYGEVIGGQTEPLETLHMAADEARWGLAGADREGFVVRFEDVLLEIVHYRNPAGRPRPADYRISDQGVMNVALGSRNAATVTTVIERICADGHQPPSVFSGAGIVGAYIVDPGCELELLAMPESFDTPLGFGPAQPFLGGFAASVARPREA